MKRTLGVILVVGGLLIAWLRMQLGTPQPMLAMQETRAAEERGRASSAAPPPVSLPGDQGETSSVSLLEAPAVEPPRREALPPLPDIKVNPNVTGDDRPAAVPTNEAVVGGADELKVFHLQNADAAETLRAIQPLLPREAKVSADQRTNSLIVSANPDRLVIITALLIALDEAPAKKRLPPPGKADVGLDDTRSSPSMTDRTASIADQDAGMDRDAKQLAARVRSAKEPEKSKLRAQLEAITNMHFELRQQRRAAEIAELADRVDKLRVAHQRRQENKPDILKRRLADLLDEENELKWDDVPPTLLKPEGARLVTKIADPAEVNQQLWSRLGLKLEALGAGEKLPDSVAQKHRGGLRVTEVAADTFADMSAIRRGDILVGLHVWETTSFSDVAYVLKQQDTNPQISEFNPNVKSIKFYIVRGTEIRYGFLRWIDVAEESGQLKINSDSPKLDGEWLVTLPAGFEFVGTIEKQPEGCWSFRDMRNLSGYYQLDGDLLKGITTDKKEPRDYEWLLLNDKVMVLTKAPKNNSSDYRGATLRRGAKPKTSPERSQAEPEPRSELVLVAKLQKAEVLLKTAMVDFNRVQKLVETDAVSQAELDRAAAQVEQAQADVDIAKAELEEARRATRLVPGTGK